MTMFCIASTLAMYSCLEPIVMASYNISVLPVLRIPRINLYLCIIQLELRQFLLLAASIATSATWFVFRKTDWSWILQDILGIMFSINMLKVLRLPSLKICTILLSALFFYDIFFVFITPLFMEGGKSVMVEVATGGGEHGSAAGSIEQYATVFNQLFIMGVVLAVVFFIAAPFINKLMHGVK